MNIASTPSTRRIHGSVYSPLFSGVFWELRDVPVIIVTALSYMIYGGMQEAMVYFVTPSELGAAPVAGKAYRLGGMVLPAVADQNEGQIPVEVDPGATALVLGADLDGDGAGDAVHPQQQDVQGVAALPVESLLGVVRSPDVEGRELVDDTWIVDSHVVGHLGPAAQPHAVGLRDAAVLEQRPRWRLIVGPDPLLEGAAQLRMVGLAHQVVALVVEGGVEEEAVVLDLEVLVLLANAALAQGQQLLALSESAHRYCPFL